jgi:hypothetical protein
VRWTLTGARCTASGPVGRCVSPLLMLRAPVGDSVRSGAWPWARRDRGCSRKGGKGTVHSLVQGFSARNRMLYSVWILRLNPARYSKTCDSVPRNGIRRQAYPCLYQPTRPPAAPTCRHRVRPPCLGPLRPGLPVARVQTTGRDKKQGQVRSVG